MDPIAELDEIAKRSLEAIQSAGTEQAIEEQRVRWLGRKSRIIELMKQLPALPPEQRPVFGKRVNELKGSIQQELERRKQGLAARPQSSGIDVSLPGLSLPSGTLHPISQTLDQVVSAFAAMGFEVADGPEMEFEYYNFDGLNIPTDHPSRDSMDTFFVDLASPEPKKGRLLLRTHTSPVQIRVMEKRRPPVAIVVPGRVYRRDALDPGHSFMFHQVEGLMVGDNVAFSDLKGVLDAFLKELFGADTHTRFRPHYFPFTEPSAEVDIASSLASGEGDSSFAKKEWIEIMGCGMVHPNVLKGVGYDPRKVQGFAFGMGIERIAMLRHGIKDIRTFYENDTRFLSQF